MIDTLEQDAIIRVLYRAWLSPFTTRSNFARDNADTIAALACIGWVTVRVWIPDGALPAAGNTWRVTARGLQELENNA